MHVWLREAHFQGRTHFITFPAAITHILNTRTSTQQQLPSSLRSRSNCTWLCRWSSTEGAMRLTADQHGHQIAFSLAIYFYITPTSQHPCCFSNRPS